MKKGLMIAILMIAFVSMAFAQKQAEIKFDKTTQDLGTFTEKEAVQQAIFTFTNVGDAPLVINQAIASCGCTIPSYTKGEGKFPGHFKKSITVRTNAKTEMTRLYIEGVMNEAQK